MSAGWKWPLGGAGGSLPAEGSDGEVLTVVAGSWASAAPAGGGDPSSPVSGAVALFEADSLTADPADPIDLWENAGSGGDLATAADTTRPTYREEDGLPFLEFDGSNDRLLATVAAQNANPLTMFLVARHARTGTYPRVCAFGNASGTNDHDNAGRFSVEYGNSSPYSPVVARNSQIMSRPFDGYASGIDDAFHWFVLAARFRTVMGSGVGEVWGPGWRTTHLVTVADFTFDAIAVGCGLNSGPNNFGRVDIRAIAYYASALTDLQVRQNLRYFAGKWGATSLA